MTDAPSRTEPVPSPQHSQPIKHDYTRLDFWIGAAVVYFVFFALNDARLWRPGVVFDSAHNMQIAEAAAWWQGRLDLPERVHDTALKDGRVYSHFPILFTVVAAALWPMFGGVPHWFVVLAIALPVPLLAYRLFHIVGERSGDIDREDPRRGRLILLYLMLLTGLAPIAQAYPNWFTIDWVKLLLLELHVLPLGYALYFLAERVPWRQTLLAVALVCGTSLWPVLDRTIRGGGPYYVNHMLVTIGLLLLLAEVFGRGRMSIGALGLVMMTLARQMTAAFAIPLAWLAFRGSVARRITDGREPIEGACGTGILPVRPRAGGPCHSGVRTRRCIGLVLTGAVVVAVPMVVNALKFGSPTTTGYMLIYEGRDDVFARDARMHGLFSPAFIPRNLYYTNIGLPVRHEITVAGKREVHYRPNDMGTGIWWTTPLLLWLFFDVRRILRDPASRSVLAAAAVVYLGLLFFHATGHVQRGYNRFSLDYLPALMAVIGPGCLRGWRSWISLAMIAWSVVYFTWLN